MKNTIKYLSMAAVALTLSLASCNEDPVLPPTPVPPGGMTSVGDGTYNHPISSYQLLRGYTDPNENPVWATGFIVGWIDTSASETYSLEAVSARYDTPAGSDTNLIICYELPWEVEKDADGNVIVDEKGYPTYGSYVENEETGELEFVASDDQDPNNQPFIGGDDFWEKCATVQLPSGNVRTALNLSANPKNLGRQVTIKGTSGSKYCGAYGMRDTSAYNWGAEGIYEEPQDPIPSMPAINPNATFKKVDKYEGEGQYLLVINGNKMAGPVEPSSYTYGNFPLTTVTPENGEIVTTTLNAYMFYDVEVESGEGDSKTVTKGCHIRDGYGRYVWWSSYNSFNLTPTRGNEGMLWTVEANDNGTFKIYNVEKKLWMVYDSGKGVLGASSSGTAAMPELYKLQD